MKTASEAGKLNVFWQDRDVVLLRRSREGESPPLLAQRGVSAQPSGRVVARLAHHLGFRSELDAAWAAVPSALVDYEGRPTLLLDDPGGDLLVRSIGQPWQLEPFLRVALGIAAALRQLHERGIVHKDIRPSNILFDAETGQVWLTGFGIASRLTRERTSPKPPEENRGQPGLHRSRADGAYERQVDSRSDLYSLGVTLYELLSGRLPFVALAPMEWIHSHIARPPAQLASSVPEPLGSIVMKLLAKTADDRYQTAAGLEADLERCMADFAARGALVPFTSASATLRTDSASRSDCTGEVRLRGGCPPPSSASPRVAASWSLSAATPASASRCW